MRQPPCKRYENYAWVECEKRCRGCRDTCDDWETYQELLRSDREQKNVNRILNDMNHERMYQKRGDNAMKRMMRRRKNNG